jgi:hemerythrin
MSLVSWSETLSVGIEKIDKEHRGLVDLINLLHSEMLAGKGKDVLGDVLAKLVTYTKTHFATEETLFRAHAYPQAEPHKKEHELLTQKVLELQRDFNAGKVVLSIPVLHFLRDWLQNHIQKMDMAYRLFFEMKGVK